MSTHWHVGSNVPGYLPEAPVFTFAELADAKSALIEDISSSADQFVESDDPDVGSEAQLITNINQYAEVIQLLKSIPPTGFHNGYSIHLPNSISPHDLGLTFWIQQCAMEHSDANE